LDVPRLTELADHITDPHSKQAAEQATAEMGIPPADVADVIAFAVSQPRRVAQRDPRAPEPGMKASALAPDAHSSPPTE
jgi:hypothetical protein